MENYNHFLPRLLGVNGIVLFRRIFYATEKDKTPDRLVRHERKHQKQQEEEGFFLFAIRYIIEYIINFLRYRDFYCAYYQIRYEIEARKAERNDI